MATGQVLPLELQTGEEAALWKDTISQGYVKAWQALASLRKQGSSGQTSGGGTPVKRRSGRGAAATQEDSDASDESRGWSPGPVSETEED